MLHNSINLAVASSNQNVSISASDLEKLCDAASRLDLLLIPFSPALKDDPQQQELLALDMRELAALKKQELGKSDETYDRLITMLRARGKSNFSRQIFGERECNRADYPNVQRLKKIYDIDMFRAICEDFGISYSIN